MDSRLNRQTAVALGVTGAIVIAVYFFGSDSPAEDPELPDEVIADRPELPRDGESETWRLLESVQPGFEGGPQAGSSGAVASPDAEGSSPETAIRTAGNDTSRPAGEAVDRDTPRTDPEVPRLSARVFSVIEEVQIRQLEGQWEEALNEMNALYSEFETLTPFEQATLLNYYTNTLIRLEMWEESIIAFSQMVTVPELRPDVNARALLALGQLHARTGDEQAAAGYYGEWLAFTAGMEGMEDQTRRVEQQLESLIEN